jgi:hypothetical protein
MKGSEMIALFSVISTTDKSVFEEFDIDVSEDRERLADYGVNASELANGDSFEFGPDEAAEFAEDFGLEVSAPAGFSAKLVKPN